MPLDKATYLQKWLLKADNDLLIALLALPQAHLLTEEIGFHCQQAAEKYLKACFILLDKMPPRIHDLILLLQQLPEELKPLNEGALILNEYAVNLRYPSPEEEQSEVNPGKLIEIANSFRQSVMRLTNTSEANSPLIQLFRQNGFEV
jgi:HEPN domain-containing protein